MTTTDTAINNSLNEILNLQKDEFISFLAHYRKVFKNLNHNIQEECQKKIDLFIWYYEQVSDEKSVFLSKEDTSIKASLKIEQLINRRYHLVELLMKIETYIQHIEQNQMQHGLTNERFLTLLQETKGETPEEIMKKFREAKYEKQLTKIKRKSAKN